MPGANGKLVEAAMRNPEREIFRLERASRVRVLV